MNIRSIPRPAWWLFLFASLSCGDSGTGPSTSTGTVPATIAITPSTSTLSVGAQLPLQVVVQDPDGKPLPVSSVLWTSQDPAVATVSNAGVVTALALGSTQVAASYNGRSAVATITVQRTQVAAVSLSPGQASAAVGGRTSFTAIAMDAGQNRLSDRAVIWSSSNQGVATIDASGTATAIGAGTTTITAASEGRTASATLTVSAGPVATVDVTPSPVSLLTGQTTQLALTVRDAFGGLISGRGVVWSSSNSSVATVSADGGITGMGVGTATITATSEAKTGTATVTVSDVPAASVVVSPGSVSVTAGGSVALSAMVRDAAANTLLGRAVSWSSSDPGVASVSVSGVVTGVSAGSTAITATTSEGPSASVAVTVTNAPVASVVVTPSTAALFVGASTSLSAATKDASGAVLAGRPLSWASSNPNVASVSSTGDVTGLAAGSATITATSGGVSGSAQVTVSDVPVASVSVTPSTASVNVGATTALSATPLDAAGNGLIGRSVTWSTSDAAIATVSSAGVVTGVAAGVATISATSGAGSGSAQVTVSSPPAPTPPAPTPPAPTPPAPTPPPTPPAPSPVASVTVSPSTASLQVGSTTTLAADSKDANGTSLAGRTVAWSTSDAAIATVSGAGVVTAVAPGTATITATSSDGPSGSAQVTVTAPPPPAPVPVASVSVTPGTSSIAIGGSVTLAARTADASGATLTGRAVTWMSSDGSVATVSSAGVVTGVAAGRATITATSEGKSATATVNVIGGPARIAVSPKLYTLNGNQSLTLVATAYDAGGNVITGQTFTWSTSQSSATTVAPTFTVDSRGIRGGTVIVVTARLGSLTDTATITVR